MAPKAKTSAKATAKAKAKAKAAAPKSKAAAPKSSASKPQASPLKRRSSGAEVDSPAPKLAKGKSTESVAAAKASPKLAKSKSAASLPAPKSGKPRQLPVDRCISGREAYSIHEDYTTKLNQTNIGGNNNKFYIIQVLRRGDQYFHWNRWGRVGEEGQNKLEPHGAGAAGAAGAIRAFEGKFRSKTGNAWAGRAAFAARPGLYTLVEMEEEEGAGGESAPLGKLSGPQIERGMEVLGQLRALLAGGAAPGRLAELSSRFYSLVPTNFGRRVPEPIATEAALGEKEELLKFWLRMGFADMEEDGGLTPIGGVMDVPLPATLQQACASVCDAASLRHSSRKGEELAKAQAGRPVKTMHAPLYASIMLYTSNAIYQQLNKALREQNRGAVKKYFPYLRLLFEAMDRYLPKKKTTLWRGLPVDLYDQYTVGSVQTWWNISSCTADINVARNFMKGCGGKCTLLTVESTTATDISEITFYGNEKESLLAPGTQLKVKSSSRSGNLTEIRLAEVGRCIS